ncbi:TPA: hypothetical protein EYP37_12315 [Candidatus Poribacteria bacterium]|nr:hypothetical protein [Candidatus Poribacteria bacterium]
MRGGWSTLDYLMVLRPTLMIPVWTMLLAGYLRASSVGAIPNFILIPPGPLLYTLLLFSMLMGFVYVLNQMTDVQSDVENEKLYLVAEGHVTRSILIAEMTLLILISGAMATMRYGLRSVYIRLWLLSALMGLLYSVKPFRLKGKPFLDLLSNAFGYGCLAFGIGWVSASGYSGGMWLRSLPYFLCVASTFVNTTLLDVKGDQAVGDRTTGVVLGLRGSCRLSLFLLLAALISALWLRDLIPASASVVSLPFFIRMALNPEPSSISSATKFGITSFSMIVGIFVPLYIIWLFAILFFVRCYYRGRFGIRYP